MKNLLITLNILLGFLSVQAQNENNNKIDSLLSIAHTLDGTADQVDLFIEVTENYMQQSKLTLKDSIAKYSELALKLAQNIDYKPGIAKAAYTLGKYHIAISANNAEATRNLLLSLEN